MIIEKLLEKRDLYLNTLKHIEFQLVTEPTDEEIIEIKKTQALTIEELKKIEQEKLFTEGHQIWLELLEELQPDYILVSIPIALFSKVVKTEGKKIISFKEKKDGSPRKKNYEVSLHKFQLKSGKTTNVIFGSAANKPFDTITNEQKKEIGKEVKKID